MALIVITPYQTPMRVNALGSRPNRTQYTTPTLSLPPQIGLWSVCFDRETDIDEEDKENKQKNTLPHSHFSLIGGNAG